MARARPAAQATRRRAWWVIGYAVLAAVCAVALAPLALAALGTGGSAATGTEARRARSRAERLGVQAPDLILVLSLPSGRRPDQPGKRPDPQLLRDGAGAVVTALAREPGVRGAWSADSAGDPWMRSRDGRSVLVDARLTGKKKEQARAAGPLVDTARNAAPGLRVAAAGEAWTDREVNETLDRDLRRAELLAAPVLFALLVLAYGSVVCALLPVLTAALAVGCALPVMGLLAHVVDVPRVALSAAAAIGLGLAVDYSLFLLTRVSEHTARGEDLEDALGAALRSTGRSVVFSAAAVTACLACACVVPVPLLRALALSAMVVTVLSALAALLVLPACLRLLGPRARAWDPLARWRRTKPGESSRFWRRTARVATARPLLVGGLAALLLVLLGLPFAHVRLGLVDDRTLPPQARAAATAEQLRTHFTAAPERLLTAVVTGAHGGEDVTAYRDRLAALPGVTGVRVITPAAGGQGRSAVGAVPGAAVLEVAGEAAPDTRRANAVVRAVRAVPAPGTVAVGGQAAEIADTSAAVRHALPGCLLLLAAALLVLLGIFTRTIVAPLKALVVAVISLGATLGATVLLFQEGHGSPLLGDFTVTGSLDAAVLLFTLLITLALSVDYEVFLLGRIREEYLRGGDNRTAIVDGIARTGRLLTSAAAAIVISTAAMGTSHVTIMKIVGIGVALGALVDAVLVRGVLVPAVMAALGPANWWSPFSGRS
ncbi:MMPL family transporter [Streptomyces sp. NPDC020719]|uniref:MMPL family transporter n=1 Tax=Streptomyces sp. NPDC020719 TaxID=3154896 RepID=UPI003403814F